MIGLRNLLKPGNNTSLILNTLKSTSSTMPPSKKSTSKKKAASDKESDNEALKKVKKITKPKNAKEEARLVAKVKEGVNISLFTANKDPKKSVKGTGFSNKQKAVDTIKICERDCRDLTHQKQVIVTMFNRAKFHPHRNKNMEEAMEVFAKWLTDHGLKADFDK